MASFGTRFWGVRGILPCTEANHTHKPYIDELQILHSCIGMTSPLQSKVPSQNSCVTGLDVPFRYTLFKVSVQLQLTLKFYAGMWNSWYINYTTFAINTVSLSSMSTWRHQRAFIGEKVPENRPFRDPFWRGIWHLAPLRGKSHTKTMHWWTTNIV